MHLLGTRTARAAATVSTAVALTLAPLAGSAHAGSEAATVHGCPSGYVCLYPNASWNNDQPAFKWYRYGSYNLSNQYGYKRFFNNQTGDAKARNCLGYNGTNCQGNQRAGTWYDYDYTPYNSVKLEP
ncbi:hypothetical protein [Streptomyces candidus]|uniref:Peptidase inhibitor family I36 n=1 Tax=Streptomyces candidus TaxID=67283 RepID=A0A7X0HM61_9ACTN|nr:hypothetical protein [Streptomyces candidus]MBB6438683.1 hypothetical protein [Streptomyces candidus]GHH45059.1 hypothetical protein GCM10018773_33700 [Streptomyces candidus]